MARSRCPESWRWSPPLGSSRCPTPRRDSPAEGWSGGEDIRWDAEPDLAMDNPGDEEWLTLVPLDARADRVSATMNLVLTEQQQRI